ncbi:uncharacterized protein [Argopecten irradians]|uniref:uncharacterized protein n=1 Tax=Argopecten irradians TaxID=31199 RepID=UPI00371A9CE0
MPRRIRLGSSRPRVRYDSPDDCCTGCCLTCCCCCCWSRSMVQRKSRIKMLWMYFLITGLIVGITVGVVFYGSVFTDFTATDMRVIDRKISHAFCDSINIDTANVKSNFAPFSAYLVDGPVEIDPIRKEKDALELTFDIQERWSYATRQFHLLSGSSAKLFCPEVTGTMDVVIMKGRSNYTRFMEDSPNYHCIGCEFARVQYSIRHSGPTTWTFPNTDEYFFVFVGHEALWADCKLDLTRSVYKTDTTASCYKVTTCEFSLSLQESNPPKQVIVKLEPDKDSTSSRYMYSTTSIQSTCVARLWVYILIFLCCPAMLCIIFSVLIYKCCSDPEEEEDDNDDDISDERSPLLWDNAPNYSAVVTEPPKYEDIIGDNRLPSYEEAVASGSTIASNITSAGGNRSGHYQSNTGQESRTNDLDNVNIIDLDSAIPAPNNNIVNTSVNTQEHSESQNSFTGVPGSVNLDQTSRVLVMNLSSDSTTNESSGGDDIESSSSDNETDDSDSD